MEAKTVSAMDWFELLTGKLATQELAVRLLLSGDKVSDAIEAVRFMETICKEAADLMQKVADGESTEWRKFDA